MNAFRRSVRNNEPFYRAETGGHESDADFYSLNGTPNPNNSQGNFKRNSLRRASGEFIYGLTN